MFRLKCPHTSFIQSIFTFAEVARLKMAPTGFTEWIKETTQFSVSHKNVALKLFTPMKIHCARNSEGQYASEIPVYLKKIGFASLIDL